MLCSKIERFGVNWWVWLSPAGPLPLGYRYEAQKNSEETHEIPISGFDRAVGDYRQLLWEIESFISPQGSSDMPAVFASVGLAQLLEPSLEHRVLCLSLCVSDSTQPAELPQ